VRPEWHKLPLRSTEGDTVGIPEDALPENEPRHDDERVANGSGDVGARVTGILEAAEQAAEQIRSDALRQVHESLRRAEGDAEARIEELTREAARVRAEADDYARDIRQAVDSYGTQARREAEEEARRLVTDAEDQARATREAAQAMAEQIQADAYRRHETLLREAKALEERRQRVLDGLRDLAAQLQDALVEPTRSIADEDSLIDALDVERRR
jgi:chromosome segregation ATPase